MCHSRRARAVPRKTPKLNDREERIEVRDYTKFYIDGDWVDPVGSNRLDVINPATEEACGVISLGTEADVDLAAAAAHRAFARFSTTSRNERIELLEAIAAKYQERFDDMAKAITEEMGAPAWLAKAAQARVGREHLLNAAKILRDFKLDDPQGQTLLAKEPIGVCAFITPWNWPSNQIGCKIAPAIATGCTVILKPSEIAPFSGYIWAEIMDSAGVPAGVFNLVNGEGPVVGAALAWHPKVDMVSFTGSTRAGIEVAKNAASTVKRVHQELGGKSPNIILDDADLAEAVPRGIMQVMVNSGQSCNAPTRMLVPKSKLAEAIAIAKETAETVTVGDPDGDARVGPLVSETQWDKVQGLIQKGLDEGATLVTGGLGKPDDCKTGYFVKPTIFADVTNDMTIAREEIFGPVVSIISYETEEEAVEIGNDTDYGLAAYVQSTNLERARGVARKLRAGQVNINGTPNDPMAPFGGYKQSGNGREWGPLAFEEFLEVKAILGFEAP